MGQGARLGVDGEADERVRDHDGAVGGRVFQVLLEAGGNGQELVVGLDLVGGG